MKVTKVFDANYDAFDSNYRIIGNEGSSRSTKTYSLLQMFVVKALEGRTFLLDVVSHSMPHLKRGALYDFLEIVRNEGLFNENNFNKTDKIYTLLNATFRFFAVDEEGKAKGIKRDYLFINECDLLPESIYLQLEMRTTQKIFIDYNPAYDEHYVFDLVDKNDDALIIKSTYLDNPFLSDSQIKSIESLKTRAPLHWRVYGLGERTSLKEGRIYNDWKVGEFDVSLPYAFGLDFGYEPDPTALVKVAIDAKRRLLYVDECVYSTKLKATELLEAIQQHATRNDLIIADSAEKRLIQTYRQHLNMYPSKKGVGSVGAGIKLLQDFTIIVSPSSINIQKELRNYAWNDKKAGIPIGDYNHALDAVRYVVSFIVLARKSKYITQ